MAKQALALKYRPKTFNDVVEQDAIKATLSQQLETGNIMNCYLFTGGAGTGKTSSGRIFANEINNGSGNIIEIDAASNNSVDDIRRIIEDAKYKSMTSKYKVYLIDEAHMITNAGWNAFLKTCEEPPANTVFIMATTDPQKIPNTILSRVQRYDFRKISFNGIVSRLKYIIENENNEGANITYEDSAIEYIAKLADGGMRDSITLMDKCLSLSNELTLENVFEGMKGMTELLNASVSAIDTMGEAHGKQAEVIKKTVSINQDIAESIRNENEQFNSINEMAESNANDTAEVTAQANTINEIVEKMTVLLNQGE